MKFHFSSLQKTVALYNLNISYLNCLANLISVVAVKLSRAGEFIQINCRKRLIHTCVAPVDILGAMLK